VAGTTQVRSVGGGGGAERRAQAHPRLALTVIASAQLMVVLDATIVNVALPRIHEALHFSGSSLSWVLNAYTLVFGGMLLLGGRMGDLFGRRRMFMVGVLLFALASLLGGFAQDSGWLLAMRALQGVGGAIASPTALSLLATTFEEGPARDRAFGVYAAVSGAGAAIGLILGGILVEALSWRWVLFVNVPIGLVIAAAAPRLIPETADRVVGELDVPGAITSTGGIAALVYGFIRAATSGWGSPASWLSFIVAAVLLTGFVIIEATSKRPLLPLRLLRDRTRTGSYFVMLVLGAAVVAMFFFLIQYVQLVKGFSPLQAGAAFLPVTAAIITTAQLASRVIARVGAQILIMTGTVAVGLGLLLLSSLTSTSSYPGHVLPGIVLIGLGMGGIFVPITLTAIRGVAPADAGVASAMLNVTQQVGSTLGLSALVTVASHAGGGRVTSAPTAFTHAAAAAYRAGAGFALAGLMAAILLIRDDRVDP
jgi:EmrB/QacA subfamily drug resistance transporter